jgi:hypothetical protein
MWRGKSKNQGREPRGPRRGVEVRKEALPSLARFVFLYLASLKGSLDLVLAKVGRDRPGRVEASRKLAAKEDVAMLGPIGSDALLDFGPEVLEETLNGPGGGVTESTDAEGRA